MKYLLTWFWFSLFSPILFGQNLPAPFPPTLEIQFSTSTYQNTNPKNIHGLGIVFTKPFSRHFDYRFNLNGSYADSISQKQPINSQKSLMLQADITSRAFIFFIIYSIAVMIWYRAAGIFNHTRDGHAFIFFIVNAIFV